MIRLLVRVMSVFIQLCLRVYVIYYSKDKYVEAEPLIVECFAVSTKNLDNRHPSAEP